MTCSIRQRYIEGKTIESVDRIIGSSVEIQSQSTTLSREVGGAKAQNCTTAMAVNLKIKVPLAGPHIAVSTFMLIASAVTFVGTLAMKYECAIIFENYLEEYMGKPILFLIVGSVLVFANGCLGLISLAQRWYHCVIAFLVCTVYLLVTMIVLVAVAYVFSSNTEETIFLRLEQDTTNSAINSEVIDTIQLGLKCCGYNNFSDWLNNSTNLPQSCCVDDLPCDPTNSSTINTTGCRDALHTFLYFRVLIVLVILAVVGILEVVSIVLSVIVLKDFAREITTSETSAIDNAETDNSLPRVYNPLGQNSLPSVDNSNRPEELYVRRPSLRPVVLNYRSPHESFLRHPPQLRFDRRIMLPSIKHTNPYATRPG